MNPAANRSITVLLALAALVAGCGREPEAARRAEDDPAVTGALGDEIMVDGELAGQQGAGDTGQIELPPEWRTPEMIASARAEAARLAGGALQSAPAPQQGALAKRLTGAVTAAQIATVAGISKAACVGTIAYSAQWAARLPEALAVYPQGAVQDAAGSDREDCRLRVVSFVTPVAANEVIDFYFTRLRLGAFGARREAEGKDQVLTGSKGDAAYLVRVRETGDGLTAVDLVTSGG